MQIAGSTHGKASRSTDPYLCATSFREMWLTGSASTVDLQQQVRPPFPMLGTPTLSGADLGGPFRLCVGVPNVQHERRPLRRPLDGGFMFRKHEIREGHEVEHQPVPREASDFVRSKRGVLSPRDLSDEMTMILHNIPAGLD